MSVAEQRPRRLPRTLVVSLAIHALLLALVLWDAPDGNEKHPVVKPIEIDLVITEPKIEPAPVPPAPTPQPPAPVVATAKKQAASKAPTAQPTEAAAPSGSGPVAASGPVADSPRNGSTFLVPRVRSMLPGLGSDDSESAGHTLKNGPGEEPDLAVVNEYTAERSKAKLDDQLGEMVASAQRQSGLVDPYFTRLGADLTEGFRGAKVQLKKKTSAETFKEEVVDTYAGPAQRYAKTGSPLANAEQAKQLEESSFGRTVERGVGDPQQQLMLQGGLQSMAFAQVIKDSAQRPRLKTVMMLRQDGDGAVAEATVIEHSGDDEFDEFVLHLTRRIVRDQGDTSDDGGAPSALGWSSVWQFTWEPPQVKVKLLRVLRASNGPVGHSPQ